jgi:hypothetical protein
MVKDCPTHLDVHWLTAAQWEELIEDLMALKDVEKATELDGNFDEEDFA